MKIIFTGKQLAESSTLGPKADKSSEFPSELSVSNSSTYSDESIPALTGEEATIALSQLQELEVAIKVRKGSRVDGRKTRWDLFRKGHKKSNSISESVSNSSETECIAGLEDQKDIKVIKKETSAKKSYKISQLKAFARKKSKSGSIQSVDNSVTGQDTTDDIYTTNNNSAVANNYNHSDTSTDNMKVEDNGPVLGPIETNNVLETMKQQFLEGTCNISESTPLTSKDKKIKRTKNNVKVDRTNVENIKRKPGRPKKKEKNITSTPKTEINTLDLCNSLLDKDKDLFTPVGTETVTPKKDSLVSLSMSPDFYLKKNPVTRGLREVRKSESGSESNSSTPVKDASFHLQLSPVSPPLALSPNTLSPLKYENTNGTTKFPLISAAKALMDYELEQQSGDERKNKFIKKLSKNKNLLHKISPQKVQTENGYCQDEDSSLIKLSSRRVRKRGRGKKKASLLTWPKKTSMVVADVHNSMNGEPQAVLNTSAISRKKKSLPPKAKKKTANKAASGSLEKYLLNNTNVELVNDKENSIKPTVPNLKSPQSMSKSNSSPISAYDVNTPKNLVSKSISAGVNNNNLNVEDKDSPQKNGNLNTKDQINLQKSPIVESDSKSSQKTEPVTSKKIISDKKQKPISDYVENIVSTSDNKHKAGIEDTVSNISKAKINLNNTLSKCLKPSPKKSLSDSVQNGSHLPDTNCTSIVSNGKKSLDENYLAADLTASPDPLPSPRRSICSFSPDKQKKEKMSKNKSLNAVIEKLHKPSVEDSKESDIVKCNNGTGGTNGNTNEEKFIHSAESLPDEYIEHTMANSEKIKKPPRFLTQLFKDEGIQLMLGSIKSDVTEDGSVKESGQHKLRPKRTNDNLLSESPEPEEYSQKRKKRHTEVDNLFVDEGTLNLLTSIESSTRRPSVSDDTSLEHMKSNKAFKTTVSTLKIVEGKKRKLSGTSNSSGSSKYNMPESKRIKLTLEGNKSLVANENVKKKVGRPSNADLLKKKQQQEHQAIVQRNSPKEPVQKPQVEKSVPPIKIRLNPYDDGLTRPSISPSDKTVVLKSGISPVNSKPAKPIPSVQVAEQKKLNQSVSVAKPVLTNNQPRVHGVPLKKLLPAGALKNMKIGIIKPLDKDSQSQKIRPKSEVRQSLRASLRNNEVTNHFRDIHLRKFNHFMHIIFNPSTTKMKNAFNSGVLGELCEALNYIRKDPTVNLVLLTGTGSTFCQGIDLTSLQHSNVEIRKKNAINLTRAIKEFLISLIAFPKVIVAGINGNATGLGVAMLPLFDIVIASEKAEFSLPYGELGQVPEGGATYTFPQNYGKLQSNSLFMGKKLSATQAQSMGLVSETIWHGTFIQELIPKVAAIATHPGPGLEATKALMNHHLSTKLELTVETECRALLQQWGTTSFAVQSKRYLELNEILFQSPAFRNHH